MRCRRLITLTWIVAIVAIVAIPGGVMLQGDALVRNRSMLADTIAEIFVDEAGVVVELEIGAASLQAFRNLLPDELVEKMREAAEQAGESLPEGLDQPLQERYRRFYEEDWVVKLNGDLMVPRIDAMEGRARVLRDEITGEVLDEARDGDGAGDSKERVLAVSLVYTWPGSVDPTNEALSVLSLGPPSGVGSGRANIGFVLYHEGLPVNDFAYLSQEESVILEWGDPFYSQFENRNLRRAFSAPLQGFLSVEPFEVRKELIARPLDLQHWVDLDVYPERVLDAEARAEVLDLAAAFLAERCPVKIDGKVVEGRLEKIHFINRTLRQATVVSPDDPPISGLAATLGAVFLYETEGMPEEVSMTWDLFAPRVAFMDGASRDEAGGLPTRVTREDPELVWRNHLKSPRFGSLVEIPAPPKGEGKSIPWTAFLGLLLAGLLLFLGRRRDVAKPDKADGDRKETKGGGLGWAVSAALVLAVGIVMATRPAYRWEVADGDSPGFESLDDEQARTILAGLLDNLYRAFDYRDESDAYDLLARSADGELVEQIYLEMRRGLESELQGGAKVRVKSVSLEDVEREGGTARCSWVVEGSVGHWGHTHTRRNRYQATLGVEPIDAAWKVTSLELLDEARL